MIRRFLTYCMTVVILLTLLTIPLSATFAMPKLSTPAYRGSSGAKVEALQRILAELDLYHGSIDRVYGAATEAAVRQLQRKLNIYVDGQMGPISIEAFNQAVVSGMFAPISATMATSVLSGKIIGIDPGHQAESDLALEPAFPNSNRTKTKMSAGAVGIKTKIPEYKINLQVAEKVKALLEQCGATVVMTRLNHDVFLSNIDRAQLMNQAQVDCWIRIHCNSSQDPQKAGASVLVPSKAANAPVYDKSALLGNSLLTEFCSATAASRLSVSYVANQTGFNWSSYPVAAIELGYLSNPAEDVKLNRESYQNQCAEGIFHGLLVYFSN